MNVLTELSVARVLSGANVPDAAALAREVTSRASRGAGHLATRSAGRRGERFISEGWRGRFVLKGRKSSASKFETVGEGVEGLSRDVYPREGECEREGERREREREREERERERERESDRELSRDVPIPSVPGNGLTGCAIPSHILVAPEYVISRPSNRLPNINHTEGAIAVALSTVCGTMGYQEQDLSGMSTVE